jgi:predicted O-methyltransferase YrrM
VRRGERAHPFHRFASEAAARDPGAGRRAALEAELSRRLTSFLNGEDVLPLGDLGTGVEPPSSPAIVPRAARHVVPAALLPASRLAARARRLGLGLAQGDAEVLVRRFRAEAPARVLEVGTRHGGGLFLASRAAHPEATLVTVDLPDWELDDPAEMTKRAATEALVPSPQTLSLRRADPFDEGTVAWAATALGGEADLLLLDARRLAPDPRAAGSWASLVRPGGLAAVTGGAATLRSDIAAALPGRFRAEEDARPGSAVLFLRG